MEQNLVYTLRDYYPDLSTKSLEALSKCTRILRVDKKTQLVREGQYAHHLYFVVEGLARAYYLKDGRDLSDWFAFEKEFICPIQSFFYGIPSPHYIETLESSVLLAIPRDQINLLSDEYRDIDRLGKIIVTQTMLTLQERVTAYRFENAQQKYQHLLEQRPSIELRVPLIHIASYLGITIETLSRIRNAKRKI
ncbi:MAG: Crp/Fnr family transcriptional regulator [Saprospiraceae bacterium]|nr:Crp/Fnr family transcriptional regulator [Saprospiraceae bacterium]